MEDIKYFVFTPLIFILCLAFLTYANYRDKIFWKKEKMRQKEFNKKHNIS